jgi:Type II CAAX prenyl endopeptidase Rce1-like
MSQNKTGVRGAAGEVVLIVALVLLIVWVIKPLDLPSIDLACRALVGVLLLASPFVHGDSRARLGLRADNLGKALKSVLPLSLIAAAACVAIGLLYDSIRVPRRPAVELLYYLAWAGAQQYALQAVVLQRLQDAGLRDRGPLAAALLFSAIHAPNPGLMVLTFLGGWFWSAVFSRHPNLLAVTLSHAVLAVVAASTLPPPVIAGYRIGPSYLRYAHHTNAAALTQQPRAMNPSTLVPTNTDAFMTDSSDVSRLSRCAPSLWASRATRCAR